MSDAMDEHDLEVHRDQGPCHVCGLPYEPKVKWNGGNVVTVWFPTCECAERETEAVVDRMITRHRVRQYLDEHDGIPPGFPDPWD